MKKNNKIHYGWFIVLACALLNMGSGGIIYGCAGIFFRPVSVALNVGISDISLYITIVSLTMMVAMPFAGKFVRKINIRWVTMLTVLIQCLVFFSMSLYSTIYLWYIAGFILGICGSLTMHVVTPALINTWFKTKAGIAMGVAMAFSGVGAAIFQPVGTSIIAAVGYKSAYIILAIIAAIIAIPAVGILVRSNPAEKSIQRYGEESKSVKQDVQYLDKGITYKEARKTLSFVFIVISSIIIGYSISAQMQMTTFALTSGVVSAASAGIVASTCSIGLIIGKPILGWLNDKLGFAAATSLFAIISSGGFLMLGLSYKVGALIFPGAFILGLGLALATVELPLMVRNVFGNKDFSSIYSSIMTVYLLVMAVAAFANGKIFDMTGSYKLMFYTMAAANIVLIFAVLTVKRNQKVLSTKYGDHEENVM